MNWLAGLLGLLLLVDPASGLGALMLQGSELHPSLSTPTLDHPIRHVPRHLLLTNPQQSAGPDFIEAIARGGSQGRLDGSGIVSALYALHRVEKELGFYGLEATSLVEAQRLEVRLREIWSHNISLERAAVHRGGRLLVVVWTDGVPTEVWEAVNAGVAQRLDQR